MNAISPSIAANDERFHELLAEYLRRTDHGEQVDQAAFMAAHPDYAEALAEYFDGASVVEQMAGPRVSEQDAQGTMHGQVDVETSANFQREQTQFKSPDQTRDPLAKSEKQPAILSAFGRYQIQKELGQGAMGAVYLALDTQLQRRVALKIPKFSGVEAAEMLERFYREARAAATLRHPNICPVFDVGEIDGQHYITMAFIAGRPLKDFAQAKKQQSQKQVAMVVRKLALGLAEAHAHGIIHRDLKPANIMVDKKGEPVVMDFGLARRDEGSDRHVTRSGTILGTPAYMSPEQVEGDQSKIGPPADVYSLGVVMYELLTGKVPFAGSLMSILMQIASEQPKPPSLHRPGLDSRLEAICLKMLAKRTSERYTSMNEVAKALGEYLKSPGGESTEGSVATESVVNALGGVPDDAASPSVGNALRGVPGDASNISLSGVPGSLSGGSLSNARQIEGTTRAELPSDFTAVPGALIATTPTQSVDETSNDAGGMGLPTRLDISIDQAQRGGRDGRPILQIHARTWVALAASLAGVALVLAAVTLFLRVGNVDVKVVIHDENLAVKFGKETVTFEGSGTPLRLKPGERKFIVERDGLEVETDSFVVKKDGKNVLEVSLVEGKVVVVKDGIRPEQIDDKVSRKPEEVASMLRQIGAKVEYGTGPNATKVIGIELPGQIVNKNLTDAHLESLAVFGETLQSLRCGFVIMNDSRLAVLDDLPNLRVLELYAGNVGDEAVRRTVKLKHLRLLGLGFSRVTDKHLPELKALSSLETLDLNWSQVTDAGMPAIATLGSLKTLSIEGTKVTDDGVAKLAPLTKLTFLNLKSLPGVTDRGIAHLSKMPDLTNLHLKHCRITDSSIDVFLGLTKLQELGLDGNPITQSGLDRLAKHPTLTSVTADSPQPQVAAWHGWPKDAPPPAIAPFDAKQAKAHQEAWAAYLKVPVEYTNSIGMKFRLIPPGEFLMGTPANELQETLDEMVIEHEYFKNEVRSGGPAHRVIQTHPIYLSKYEVTQATYEAVIGKNPSNYSKTTQDAAIAKLLESIETAEFPVEMVSWYDARSFCAALNRKENLKDGYRLPTEAEWEYSSRAGTTTRFATGDTTVALAAAGWYGQVSGGRTHRVGERDANQFGLHDVHGNVMEWCQDVYDPTYFETVAAVVSVNPKGSSAASELHVTRGGHLNATVWGSRVSHRGQGEATWRKPYFGMRIALSVNSAQLAIKDKEQRRPAFPLADTDGLKSPCPSAIAPFDAKQAKAHQEAWAAYLKVPVEYTNSIGMKFRLIPPGEFEMGSTPEDIERATPADKKEWNLLAKRKVILTLPFYLCANEMTQRDYELLMRANPSHFSTVGAKKEAVQGLMTANHPVEMVNSFQAAECCSKLSEKEKLKPFYFVTGTTVTPLNGTGYRLPTEAEWEFACRAGTTTRYWNCDRDEELRPAGWSIENSAGRTHAVGELLANPFGLYDVHGNVSEWVDDWWEPGSSHKHEGLPVVDPKSRFSAESRRILRGGTYWGGASHCRSANRHAMGPEYVSDAFGFRMALSVDAVRESHSRQAEIEPDRAAAEFWLGKGFLVELVVDGKTQSINQGQSLPAGRFEFVGAVALFGHANKLATEDLEKLADAKGLKKLVLERDDFEFSNETCEAVARLSGLELLIVKTNRVSFSGVGLRRLATIRNLRALHLSTATELRNEDLVVLPAFEKVENLGLTAPRVSSAGFTQIAKMPSLEALALTGVNDGCVAEIGKIMRLGNLHVDSSDMTDDGLGSLANCTSIGELKLHRTKITGQGFEKWSQDAYRTATLDLSSSPITDKGLVSLGKAKMPQLQSVGLSDTPVTSAGLTSLKAFPKLVALGLRNTAVDDTAVETLSAMKGLKSLELQGTKVSPTGLAKLRVALPECAIFPAAEPTKP